MGEAWGTIIFSELVLMPSIFWANIALLIVTITITLFIVASVIQRNKTADGKPFIYLQSAIFIWILFTLFEFGSTGREMKLVFGRLQYIGIAAIPPLLLLFVVQYTHTDYLVGEKRKLLLWIIPIITIFLAFSSDTISLLWPDVALVGKGASAYLVYSHGPWFGVWAVYSYLLIGVGAFILIFAIFEFPRLYRHQALILLIAILIPVFVNSLYIFGLVGATDLTTFSFTISGILIAYAMWKNKFLSIVPVARSLIIDNMNDGVIVLDPLENIVDINHAAIQYLGISEKEAIGKNVSVVFHQIDPLIWEQAQEEEATFEVQLTAPNEIKRNFNLRISNIRGSQGILTGRIVVLRETTERWQTENALRDSEALYYSLVDNMYVAVFMKDMNGVYTYVNRLCCELNGLAPYEILGKTDFDLHPLDKAELFAKTDQDVIRTGLSFEADETFNLPAGGTLFIHVVKFPVRNREGKIVGIQGVLWDITKSIQNESALRHQADQLSTLNRVMQALSSSLKLRDVLDNILSELHQIVPYDSTSVFELKGEEIELVGGRGFPNLDQLLGIHFRIDDESTPSTIVLRNRSPHILDDAPLHYPGFSQGEHAAAQIHGWMGVPLLFGNNLIGMLSLDKHEANFFTEEHAKLASTFAAQAAIAIQNARLYEREHRRMKSQMLLFNLSVALTSTTQEEDIWEKLAHGLYDESLDYKNILIFERDPKSDNRVIRSFMGWEKSYFQRELRPGEGVTELTLNDGKAHYFEDISKESKYVPGLPAGSEATVPIKIGEEIVGVLSVMSHKVNNFTQEDLDIFSSAANQAGLALGKARLFKETQQRYAEIASLQEKLREQAIRDSLTGLYNRRYLDEVFENELAHAQKSGHPVSIIIMDMDHFKRVNDTFGHKTGDRILQMLGGFLRAQSRNSDIICRFGGEEFIVILPNTSTAVAQQRAEQWRVAFKSLTLGDNEDKIATTLSLGVASYPEHGKNSEELLIMADTALYQAKQNGRDQVIVYDDTQSIHFGKFKSSQSEN